jgi:hypothetical protein
VSEGNGVADGAGLGVGGSGGKVGLAVGDAPATATGSTTGGGAARRRPATRLMVTTRGTASPRAAMRRLRVDKAFQDARMEDMAGPYQTSPNLTLVRKYRRFITRSAAYTGVRPGGPSSKGAFA